MTTLQDPSRGNIAIPADPDLEKCFPEAEKGVVSPEIREATAFVFFEYDKDQVNTEIQHATIESVACLYNAGTKENIRITGHADSRGTEYYNKNLSLRRANYVDSVLRDEYHVNSQVQIDAKGESNPLRPVKNPEARGGMDAEDEVAFKCNRRVELYSRAHEIYISDNPKFKHYAVRGAEMDVSRTLTADEAVRILNEEPSGSIPTHVQGISSTFSFDDWKAKKNLPKMADCAWVQGRPL